MEMLYFIISAQLVVSAYLAWKVKQLEDNDENHYLLIGFLLKEINLREGATVPNLDDL